MKKKLSLFFISVLSVLILVLSGCAASGTTGVQTGTAATSGVTGPTSTVLSSTTTSGQTSSTQAVSTTGTSSTTPGTTSNATTGQIQVRVTDAPANKNVTSVDVTVDSVEVEEPGSATTTSTVANSDITTTTTDTTTTTTTNGQQEQEHGNPHNQNTNTNQNQDQSTSNGGWVTLNLTGNTTFDLLQVKNLEDVLASANIAPGTYNQIRMDVSSVVVGFSDGTTANAKLPSGKLRFVQPFGIAAGKTTVLLFDFNAAKSIVQTGNGEVIFKPVIKLSVTKTPGEMQIITSALPNGEVGVGYTQTTLAAMGGSGTYTWTILSGEIPGLSLSPEGVLSGTPTTAGNYTINVQVKDSSTPAKSDTQKFTVNIAASGALQIITTSLPDGTVGTAYSATLQSVGGATPVTWSSDDLPAWLNPDISTGTISGTPTASGDYTFTVKVTDSASPAVTVTQSLTIHVSEITSG